MTPAEIFELIVAALGGLTPDLTTDLGKRVYLAYLAARAGQGESVEPRFTELRAELGL